jgi:hypothetical protein
MTAVCEYQALSTALRQLIGFKLLIEELTKYFQIEGVEASISTTVWEDNQGALYLATNQRLTSRTKYFHVKWHHFWASVGPEPDKIQIMKVNTSRQDAHYLTKGLA